MGKPRRPETGTLGAEKPPVLPGGIGKGTEGDKGKIPIPTPRHDQCPEDLRGSNPNLGWSGDRNRPGGWDRKLLPHPFLVFSKAHDMLPTFLTVEQIKEKVARDTFMMVKFVRLQYVIHDSVDIEYRLLDMTMWPIPDPAVLAHSMAPRPRPQWTRISLPFSSLKYTSVAKFPSVG